MKNVTTTRVSTAFSVLNRFLVGVSSRMNYEWAMRRPHSPRFTVLAEFPRSGGNWVRDMVGDALQLPVPRHSRLPIDMEAVILSHDHRPLLQHPCIYVVRDGRDVFVSHVAKTITTFRNGDSLLRRRLLRMHPSLEHISEDFIAMPEKVGLFYDEWKRRPLGSRVNWGTHVSSWLDNSQDNISVVRYEDLMQNPVAALSKLVVSVAGKEVDTTVLEFVVKRNSFQAQTGREAGAADMASSKRRGTVGAWRDEMPAELKRLFVRDFGSVLARTGYDCTE